MLADLIGDVSALKTAFDYGNFLKIRHIAKKCIERSALASDKSFARIAVIAYALGKLSSKDHIVQNTDWPKIREHISRLLDHALKKLKAKNVKAFNADIEELTQNVFAIDETFGNYLINIYDKAKIKLASSAYAFGLSLSSAAELTDADKKDVFEYIGRTKMHDEEGVTLTIEQRLKSLRKVLRS